MPKAKKQPKRLIFLNFGSKNRKDISSAKSSFSFEFYKTKEMGCFIENGLTVTFIYKNKSVDFKNSYVFTRLRGSDAHFCGILHEHLERHKIRFNDLINLKFQDAEEKIAQMPRLAEAHIRVPETIIARQESFAANEKFFLSKISFPAIFKIDGSKGRNVHIVQTEQQLKKMIDKQTSGNLFLIQEFVQNEWDTRTLLMFDKNIGTIKRKRRKGFLNNVSQGASVEKFELTKEDDKIAKKACQVNGIDFGGVDLIHTKNGPVVLEVNKSPQINGFESIFGLGYVWKQMLKQLEKKSG